MNEQLKNANSRNKAAHKSYILTVSFGYLYFCYFKLLGRKQDILKDCAASEKSGLRALEDMKIVYTKDGQDNQWKVNKGMEHYKT